MPMIECATTALRHDTEYVYTGTSLNKASSEKGLTWSGLPGLVNFSSHQKLFVVVGIVGIVWSPGQYNTPDPFRPFGTGLI